MNNVREWLIGEYKAEKYLKSLGYKILDKNCKIAGSEIDIVAIYPKKLQKNDLNNDFKNKTFDDYKTKHFYKKVLRNNIQSLEDVIVFVEVKSRFSKKIGEPYEAVNNEKRHNILRGAKAYLAKNKLRNMIVRFDVISIVDDEIDHIINAFDADV